MSEHIRMMPDFDQTSRFLDQIAPDGTITFQSIAEARPPGIGSHVWRREVQKVLHGSFEEHCKTLAVLNNFGAGVFFMVNRGDGIVHFGAKTCRTTANVVAVRALFVDLDGAPVAPVLAHDRAPEIVVESSPGKYHAYWLTPDCPIERFSELQTRLASCFAGDPAVKDLPRVMRLPGFYHQKRDPFMTKVIELSAGASGRRSQAA
jgi:hypothetical protein